MNKDLVWIKAKCQDYARLLQKLQIMHIKLFEIKYDKKLIYLKVTNSDFEKIEKYLSSFKFKIVGNTGLAKVVDILKSNKIFVFSIVLGIGLFFVLKNLIVEVNIIHENKEIRELLKDELDSYGIKVLSFKKSYRDLDQIRQAILDKYPDKLDWMEFEVEGMIVNVKVEERIITDTSKSDKACNIVAKKNGVVKDIVVYDGEAAVLINDYVRAGDILIKGEVFYNDKMMRYTCASGEVFANVWYTVNVSVPFNYTNTEETNKKRYNLVWEHDGNKKELLRSRIENHNNYYKNILKFFDYNLYLTTQVEVIKKEGTYTEEEALNEGINKALESVEKKLGDKDEIIDKKVLQKTVNDSKMDIEVFVVVSEAIGMENVIEVEEGID